MKINARRTLLSMAWIFAAIHDFHWDSATVFEDTRHLDIETRLIAYGYIHARLVVVAYTFRHPVTRIISLRKANKREVKHYG